MRYLSLFSGIGSPEEALRNIGVNFELVGFSEIDKYATQSYCNVHDVDEMLNLGDISSIDLNLLPKDIDLITHGSPCFPYGTKVLTDKGYKEIQDVVVGDMVLTHTNQFKKVYDTMTNKSSDIYTIKTQCSFEFRATGNHPFYVREKCSIYDKSKRNMVRTFKSAEWKWLKDLNKNYFVGVAINQESKYPEWSGVSNNQNNNVEKINNLSGLFVKSEFWYLVGRFVGDGWITEGFSKKENKPTYRTTICCSHNELEELESKINGILKYSVAKERTVYKLQFSNKELTLFLKQFGKGAKNKCLTETIFNLPKHELECFLDGYLDSDGCIPKNSNKIRPKYKITSISEDLILGVGQVVAKLYNVPFSISKTIRPKTCIIEGRTVNQNDTYQITFFKEQGGTHGFYEDGYVWMPIRSVNIVNSETIDVYNLEVEEDHSYTVNNIIVHNCQDYSKAGNREGGDEGSGTRSSLMWNTVSICEHTKPKYVIWENVRNVLSPRHIHNFEKYLDRMGEMGYKNYFKILNSKDFGVPQNRERIFVISIRNDVEINFEFPKEYYNDIKLQDLLETSIDNKYYIDIETEYFGLIQDVSKDNDKEFKVRQATKQGYDIAKEGDSINLEQPNSKTRRGRVGKGVANTLNTSCNQAVVHDGRVRKMTPLEYWRLMGFSDESYYKAKEVSSDNQLYKQAGNSIVVNVMESIFVELFKEFK